MTLKKIIIPLIVLLIVGGGLYLVQKKKQKNALIAHNLKKFEILKADAGKSSAAGLLVMASAINRYHQINGRYPDNLLNLFPDLIPDKAFITTLNWQYTPGKGSYTLEKSAEHENIVALMGPDLRLKTRALGAAPSDQKAVAAESQQKQPETSPPDPDTPKKADTRKTAVDQLALANSIEKAEKVEKKEPDPSVRIVKTGLTPKEQFLLSFESSNLYIWKTKEGFIGFSNIQYPDKKDLVIFRENSWIEYQRIQNSEK